LRELFKTGKPDSYEVSSSIPKTGTIWFSTKIVPIKYDGKVSGAILISTGITERKQMEEKLRQYSEHLEELVQKRTEELLESEKRYSVLVEEASDGVGIIQDGKVVFVNKKVSEIIGYSTDELIGLPFEKVVDEKYLQLAMEGYIGTLRGETLPAIAELGLIVKTGERVPIEASSTFINYQGRPATLVILRDIRERKRMEEQRLKLEKLAAIGELATMVGHDLRNPLQSIENATYYLNNELPRILPSILISQKATEMLQIINDSVNYADKIIRDLHDFSATKKPILQKTNINAIVKETLSQVKTPENVKLITELGHLPEIKADRGMIKRAFLNLAMNGIQAMEKGGTLKISTKKTKEFIEISFKDTGIGLPKENMKKLFTPFFTTRAKGMGMGLPICKKFVEIHGGTIEVESEEEKGSTFTVKLPTAREWR
jgi:PAS domain S-box-containing protein